MSIKQYPGGIVTKNPTAPTTSSAKGIWTVCQAANYAKQGIWPRSPGAPTSGTATDAASGGAVSVAFTAPSCTGSNAITGYIATSTPGSVTGTAASSPVTVSGLTNGTAYTFKVKATNGAGTGPESAASNSATPTLPVVGQQEYTTSGTYSWVAPAGVTRVSVVAVGSGAPGGSCGNGGGGLGYKNNYTVVPGNSYTVSLAFFGASYFVSSGVVQGGSTRTPGSSGTFVGDGGGNGGFVVTGSGGYNGGGGGAGGYSGNGGNGATRCTSAGPQSGSNGSGGGGGGGGNNAFGGGVGLLGQGCSGVGGAPNTAGTAGSGGSGTSYGGAAHAGAGLPASNGAVRIIWPGNTRSFPSTCTGNL